jgi:hypothetical protein
MRWRGPFCVYALYLLWLDGTDLRGLALSGRKALLRKLLPRKAHAVRYVEHVANGTDLFRVICDRDMEGIVAKRASARYTGRNDLGEDQEPTLTTVESAAWPRNMMNPARPKGSTAADRRIC